MYLLHYSYYKLGDRLDHFVFGFSRNVQLAYIIIIIHWKQSILLFTSDSGSRSR